MTELFAKYIEIAAAHAPTWGYLIIFLLMTIESSFIPFPSEVVMIPAGFLAARSAMTFHNPALDATLSVVIGVAGSLAGAFVNYYLARWLGRPFLYKYGKYFFLKPQSLMRAEELFREYGAGITFVCRMLPEIRQLISIPAGIAGMRLRTFTICTALGAGIWVAILTGIGYYFGIKTAHMTYLELVEHGKELIHQNLHWILLGCAAFFAIYVYVHKLIMRSPSHKPSPVAAPESETSSQ